MDADAYNTAGGLAALTANTGDRSNTAAGKDAGNAITTDMLVNAIQELSAQVEELRTKLGYTQCKTRVYPRDSKLRE